MLVPQYEASCQARLLDDCLAAVAAGDADAFSRLYEALHPWVLAAVNRVLPDRAQSEEVAQEVMLEMWLTAERYRADLGSVGAWVATMARRRAIDRVRHQCAQAGRDHRSAALDPPPAHDSVGEQVERALEYETVRQRLSALTDLQAQALHLTFYEDRTHQQVATQLGIPLGTAKSRIRDALIRLRRELDR